MEVVQSIGAQMDAGFRVKASGSGETELHDQPQSVREQETIWYKEGIHALVLRWRMAVDVDGDYVEK